MTALPRLLTVEETAAALRRTPTHIRYMLRNKKLVGRQLQKRGPWLIPEDAVRRIAEGVDESPASTAQMEKSA